MGQANLERTQFEGRVTVHTPANDDKQLVNFTGYFDIGDLVDVIEVDADDNILSVIADDLSVLVIDPDLSLTLSAVVDTTGLVGTPKIRAQNIDDGFQAVDRLYRRKFQGNVSFIVREPIVGQNLNTPIVGKTQYFVGDSRFIRAGDIFDIIADEGLIAANVTIDSVSPNADAANNKSAVVVIGNFDTSTFTNPRLLSRSVTVQQAIERNQQSIDEIDRPVENEYLGVGDANKTVFESANLLIAGTSKLLIDGKRLRLGTAGTRAALSSGAGNSQMIFTALILGLKGNATQVRVQAGAGLTVSVTGGFNAGFTITVNNNGGAATAKDIVDAINANPTAKRIILAQWGGTGLGVAATFGPTPLTGGLDNGTGDYAELEQVFNNFIVSTGFKFLSLWILPNDANRLNKPPKDDEEMVVDYRRPSVNI